MVDRELLELAAKAAGMELMDRPEVHCYVGGLMTTTGHWSPLTDDGDALRLAVKLKMMVNVREHWVKVFDANDATVEEPLRNDPYAATRRAIVRAAAEIGKEMK